jgi:LPXTG-site transpeptidase (sortase) family protein
MKTLLKIIFILVIFVAVVGAGYYFVWLPQRNQDKLVGTVADELFGWKYPVAKFPLTGSEDRLAYSSIRDPGGIPEGLPVRLKIPAIGVDSAIEDALITPDGRMDVPSGTKNVAWFALGPNPGQKGSAVVGGHYGFYQGNTGPTVFYKLDQLKVGEKIYIVDDKGDTLAFVVRSIKLFDRNADATTVFTSNDGLAHLNLITCEGVWNRVNDNYPQRRVVFTDAIPAEGAAPAPTVVAASRSLGIGASGADVAALQTALQAKGFLTMPPGVARGYFGVLTRAAVAKYQVSVGLPGSGVFEQLTRAKLMPEVAPTAKSPVAVKPALPSTAVTTEKLSLSPRSLAQAAKSLYTTPLDGLITSVLLIAIVFVALKIIRR